MSPFPNVRARSVRLLGTLVLTAGAAFVPASAAQAAGPGCDRVVAAQGSDQAAGTTQAPFASVNRLAEALSPGQTGCVRGTVSGGAWVQRDGIKLISEPGQRGRILGAVEIWGDGVTVEGLDLHGGESLKRPTPNIYGDDVTLRENDITNGDICVALGTDGHHGDILVERVLLERNRIHDCGQLPRTNNDHGIYVEHTKDARIVGNVIVDNADRGIQLYPNSQGTVVEGNVIDGNGVGVIFSGVDSHASSGNVVRGNLIGNTRSRNAVESWYPDGAPIGRNNVVEGNCVYGEKQISTAAGGFVARNNRSVSTPGFADPRSRDQRLAAGSPCGDLLAGRPASSASRTASSAARPKTASAKRSKRSGQRMKRVVRNPFVRAAGSNARVDLGVRRAATGRRVVELRLRERAARPVQLRIDVRRPGRRWSTLRVARIDGSRALVLTLPRGAGLKARDVRAVAVQAPAPPRGA